jgi:hypothetical protein
MDLSWETLTAFDVRGYPLAMREGLEAARENHAAAEGL